MFLILHFITTSAVNTGPSMMKVLEWCPSLAHLFKWASGRRAALGHRLWNRAIIAEPWRCVRCNWHETQQLRANLKAYNFNDHEISLTISQATHGSNSMNSTWIWYWDSWDSYWIFNTWRYWKNQNILSDWFRKYWVWSESWGPQDQISKIELHCCPSLCSHWLNQQPECTTRIMLTTQRWSRNKSQILMYHSVASHYDWSLTEIHGTIMMAGFAQNVWRVWYLNCAQNSKFKFFPAAVV